MVGYDLENQFLREDFKAHEIHVSTQFFQSQSDVILLKYSDVMQ